MEKTLLVEKTPFQIRTALIEDGKTCVLESFSEDEETVGGNIYLARIENVINGMQACFAYIGDEKNAYLYYADIPGVNAENKISKKVKQGDEMIVQIVKEKSGTKGARITANIKLPYPHFILTPFDKSIGVSHKIEDEETKNALRHVASEALQGECGCILRTATAVMSEEELAEELKEALHDYTSLKQRAAISKAGTLLSEKRTQLEEVLLRSGAENYIVNDAETAKRIGKAFPRIKVSVEETPFAKYGAEKALEEAVSRRVWLKSGGYLIFDYAEAMTVIDVNSGKFTGTKSIEDTALSINVEAACEIARQLRLRNIGGIIVVDFIDMKDEKAQQKVVGELTEAMELDETAHTVVGMTKLGLVELTRKKNGKPLRDILLMPCEECEGGYAPSDLVICENVRSTIYHSLESNSVSAILITLNREIASLVSECEALREEMHRQFADRSIYIATDERMARENYVVSYAKSSEDISAYKRMGNLL